MEPIQKRLVFIVEDNELYSLMLEYKLSNDINIQFMCFRNAEECIQHLELNPMLIILDYWLPGINGKEAFKQIKRIKPEIPVIILTHNKDEDIEKELLKNGLYDYLHKEKDPVSQIEKIINSFLDKMIKREERESTSINMKIIFYILFFIATFIALIYLNRT